jgi:hypothetical protein
VRVNRSVRETNILAQSKYKPYNMVFHCTHRDRLMLRINASIHTKRKKRRSSIYMVAIVEYTFTHKHHTEYIEWIVKENEEFNTQKYSNKEYFVHIR